MHLESQSCAFDEQDCMMEHVVEALLLVVVEVLRVMRLVLRGVLRVVCRLVAATGDAPSTA